MGNKNKTVSFRVNEDAFETLYEIAERRDLSLSAMFRDYVDALVAHDGQVEIVPEHQVTAGSTDEFPPTVEVSTSFVREHERLELEADHLREQLDEYKQYVTHLQDQLEATDSEDVIRLEEIDNNADESDSPHRLDRS